MRISTSGQYVIPSPYERQRPRKMSAQSPMRSTKSATRRDFPMPAGPSSVTSRHEALLEDVFEVTPQTLRSRRRPTRSASGCPRERVDLGTDPRRRSLHGLGFALERERLDHFDLHGIAHERSRLGTDVRLTSAGGLL